MLNGFDLYGRRGDTNYRLTMQDTVAAKKLAAIWIETRSKEVNLNQCDFVTKMFFKTFLEECKVNCCLKEALRIKWIVNYPRNEELSVESWIEEISKNLL